MSSSTSNQQIENKSPKEDDVKPPEANLLNRRYKNLLLSQKYVDCTFRIGQTTVQCHKLVLAAASPVFEAMFYGPMREEQSIEILDISPEMFHEMIAYIYTGEIDFGDKKSLENAIELYYCAEKYLLNDLIAACLNAIKSKLHFENILPALDLSVYMDLKALQQICSNFFTRCCLNNLQFMAFLKSNYFHVSKDCIKAIIAINKNYKILVWFILEWCQNECENLGLAKSQCNLVINDLDVTMPLDDGQQKKFKRQDSGYNLIERVYYKACRPFTIDNDNNEFYVIVQPNRFIALNGIIINSRLMPSMTTDRPLVSSISFDYYESLQIEISSEYDQNGVIFRHQIDKCKTRYNCDFIISWDDDVTLVSHLSYRIKLTWKHNAFGAEYPCSLQANEVDGIQFKDMGRQFGSIVKGLKFLNL